MREKNIKTKERKRGIDRDMENVIYSKRESVNFKKPQRKKNHDLWKQDMTGWSLVSLSMLAGIWFGILVWMSEGGVSRRSLKSGRHLYPDWTYTS